MTTTTQRTTRKVAHAVATARPHIRLTIVDVQFIDLLGAVNTGTARYLVGQLNLHNGEAVAFFNRHGTNMRILSLIDGIGSVMLFERMPSLLYFRAKQLIKLVMSYTTNPRCLRDLNETLLKVQDHADIAKARSNLVHHVLRFVRRGRA